MRYVMDRLDNWRRGYYRAESGNRGCGLHARPRRIAAVLTEVFEMQQRIYDLCPDLKPPFLKLRVGT